MKNKFKGYCPCCNKEEIYCEVLTEGLCLNCYYQLQQDRKQLSLDTEHDYAQGLY